MVYENLVLIYYGDPPYYRHIASGKVMKLPFSVRMPDGSSRTDPEQWSQDPEVMVIAGFEQTEITQEDINAMLPKLSEEKEKRIFDLQNIWQYGILKEGYTTPEGWALGIDTDDVSLLTGAFLLLKESSALGLGDTTTIIDMEGIPHVLSLAEMTNLMLQYGQFRSTKSQQYSAKLQQIKDATTVEELNNMDLTIGE